MSSFIRDISLEDIFMFFAIWFALLIILAVAVIIIKKKRDAEDKAQPVRRKNARIIDMQRFDAGEIVIGEPWVLFELENGSRVKLNAKQKNHLMVGDVGLLTWQGRKILKFERNIVR